MTPDLARKLLLGATWTPDCGGDLVFQMAVVAVAGLTLRVQGVAYPDCNGFLSLWLGPYDSALGADTKVGDTVRFCGISQRDTQAWIEREALALLEAHVPPEVLAWLESFVKPGAA